MYKDKDRAVSNKRHLSLALNAGTIDFWRGVTEECGLVSTTGRTHGQGNISRLLEVVAHRVQAGYLRPGDLLAGVGAKKEAAIDQ